MPYRPPFFLVNNHVETIYPALLRKVDFTFQTKERISTPDNDFLDTTFSRRNSSEIIIISHGLEGDFERPYIRGMAKACFDGGYDVLAWNYRGCGAEMNRQLRFYHSGATDDLDTVTTSVLKTNRYIKIHLVGFSLGGNITLKYVGEDRERPSIIGNVVAISVPMDLSTSCATLMTRGNTLYHTRFLKSLKNKIITKSRLMEGLSVEGIHSIKTLKEFDDKYTAVLHGFANANEYYNACSSLRFVDNIKNKTLIINAANDPFLSPECYPVKLLENHKFVRFEIPSFGGHVGFAQFNQKKLYWSEKKALEFLKQ